MRLPLKKFAKITVILQSPTTTCTLEVYDNSQCFVVIFLDLLFLSLIFQFPRPIHLERTCSRQNASLNVAFSQRWNRECPLNLACELFSFNQANVPLFSLKQFPLYVSKILSLSVGIHIVENTEKLNISFDLQPKLRVYRWPVAKC